MWGAHRRGRTEARCRKGSLSTQPPAPFRRSHLTLIQPEIVGNLVPQSVGNQFEKRFPARSHALMWTLKQDDLIGHGEAVKDATPRQRASLIKTKKGCSPPDPCAAQLGWCWFRLYNDGDILHALAEPQGDAPHGLFYKSIEV